MFQSHGAEIVGISVDGVWSQYENQRLLDTEDLIAADALGLDVDRFQVDLRSCFD